jgi:2-alkenal reductase
VRLASRPENLPGPEHFEIVEVPLPHPAAGQVPVRNLCLRISASVRMMISQGAEDVPGVPFPALAPGDVLAQKAIGRVVSAPAGSSLRPGDLVSHHLGWCEYAAVDKAKCTPLGQPELPDPAAYLGHGETAYAALTRGVHINPGDCVFVTAASGAIGSVAGQIARLLGAGRVVGSTGSQTKAERLVSELGYDAAAIRGAAEPFAAQLAKAAPDGVDVVLDNVGGEQLAAAVSAANEGARLLVLGTLSGQLAPHGTGRRAPVELDSVQILLKKLTLRGYSADDDPDVEQEWYERSTAWLRDGQITFPSVRIKGIDRAPEALLEVIAGKHFGTVIVEL